jgi:hypothetical protein
MIQKLRILHNFRSKKAGILSLKIRSQTFLEILDPDINNQLESEILGNIAFSSISWQSKLCGFPYILGGNKETYCTRKGCSWPLMRAGMNTQNKPAFFTVLDLGSWVSRTGINGRMVEDGLPRAQKKMSFNICLNNTWITSEVRLLLIFQRAPFF